MTLPVFFILNAGRIVPIVVGIGTALARFVAKNPRILGSTLSIEAISSAIQSYVTTEKEKIAIVDEIEKKIRNSSMTFSKMYFSPTTILCQKSFLIWLYS